MENDKRIYKWDNVKLFLIFLVIFGHILDREASLHDSWKRSTFGSIHSICQPLFLSLDSLVNMQLNNENISAYFPLFGFIS